MGWTTEDARRQYNIPGWGNGYVDVDDSGHLLVSPSGRPGTASVDLRELADRAHAAGLTWPVLVRFTDILHTQVDRLCGAFSQAIRQHALDSHYTAVYPIKVNQQRHVVEPIIRHGGERIGLEAGSKPELMALLGIAPPGTTIICNGYKDAGYIRLALIGQQLGHRVTLVIEKLSELDHVIRQGDALGVRPRLGLRVRLAAATGGNWQNTGGDRSKFGFTAAGTLALLERVRAAGLTECIHMLHCHPGSQITDMAVFRQALQEMAHMWVELRRAGLPLGEVDAGGGLGVDYDGTASDNLCSVNYDMAAYADAVVGVFADICRKHALPAPAFLTESGRALTAHHALLITSVIDTERVLTTTDDATGDDNAVLAELRACREHATAATDTGRTPAQPDDDVDDSTTTQQAGGKPAVSASDIYARACNALSVLRAAFADGDLSLTQRACGETLYYSTCEQLRRQLADTHIDDTLLDEINRKLADKYFCNLSVFQSMPDVWGIDQVFPIMPLQRLDQAPDRRATLHDLTCDSDGHIEYYVDSAGIEHSLPVHAIEAGEDYLLGFFMLGAYQEILGDMHNLFGDTDAVNVELTGQGGYRLVEPRHGDTVDELLRYVEFTPAQLLATYRDRLAQADLSEQQRQQYLQVYEAGLSDTTYLHHD
ncbi:MAG: biosynthetic arginine decarboxylase [Halobacteria archaeon]|nr:biosynthetic arginine decarboxylase [Halobacteria archaeon]